MGEILGLTWENVHISDEDIAADNAYVYIDKELTRASKRAIETLGEIDQCALCGVSDDFSLSIRVKTGVIAESRCINQFLIDRRMLFGSIFNRG